MWRDLACSGYVGVTMKTMINMGLINGRNEELSNAFIVFSKGIAGLIFLNLLPLPGSKLNSL